MSKRAMLTAVIFLGASGSVAQEADTYAPPRTEHGQPDFQGVWTAASLTMLERPPVVPNLVVPAEQAPMVAQAIIANLPQVRDPHFDFDGIAALNMVEGEYRSSVIVDPANGMIPYSEQGLEIAAWAPVRMNEMFDDPEQRPLAERCLESFVFAPMRPIPAHLPIRFIQTKDHVAIWMEDADGLRVIDLDGEHPPEAVRSVSGHSIGHWDGDTLVIETTNLSALDPIRMVFGRPVALTPDTVITERLRRVSDSEIVYHYTVEDEVMYTQPWSGEFSLRATDWDTYEYGCHEGNYAIANVLRGGRAQAARQAAAEAEAAEE